jgi:puromycin-sensitive aminopeptidase
LAQFSYNIFFNSEIKVSFYLNDKNETILKLKQKRFFSNGSKPNAEENFLWKVPITIMTKSSCPNIHRQILMENESEEINCGILQTNDWIKLNKNTVGLYRTNYSSEMLHNLVALIKEQSIHPTDRLGLQSDIFALSQAGLMSPSQVLKFVEAFAFEENVTVWKDLLNNLLNLSHLLLNTNYHHEFQSFIRKLLKPISRKLGWEAKEGESNNYFFKL